MSKGNGTSESGLERNEKESDLGLSIQQVIQFGQLSSQLLQNPVYNVASEMARVQIIEGWANTHPKETAKREGLWHELQALGRINQTMAGLVERAQQVVEQESQRHHASEQEYLDQQGYGLADTYQ